ncbi:MAG: DUF420 domain-containing protein [Nitrososphaerota archaeon]|nr:DUF420 domain-containing protein [Nitrososphaerota archaeon]
MRFGLITAFVTLVAYAVLGFVLIPPEGAGWLAFVPEEAALYFPHIIAAINLITVVLLQLGYRSIRRRRIHSHAIYMGASFILITVFLVLYVLKIAALGPEVYKGPEVLRNFVYLPSLAVHLALSIASVPLVFYNALTGYQLRARAGLSYHRRVGKLAYPAWTVSLALGLLVYAMLRLAPGG